MAENDMEALAAKADRGPWHFDKSTGQIYRRPDHLTKYIIAEMESSNDANGELVVALVNSFTAPVGITAPERPPIMLDIAAASETDEMWKRRWLALCQMYERDPCFVDSNGKWGLRDLLDYAAEVCGFIASPTALTALRSTTAEPVEVAERIQDMIETAYIAGATAVHEAWVDGNGQSEADFAEAASDYGVSVSEQIPRPTDSAAKDAEIAAYREALTPSGDTKAAYHGEFTFDTEDGVSDAGIEQWCKVYVPWTTVKEIMKAISNRAALANRGEAGSLAKEREE